MIEPQAAWAPTDKAGNNISPARTRLSPVLAGTGILSLLWSIAALFSGRGEWQESLLIVATQTFLSFLALLFFSRTMPKSTSAYGPGLMPILALHVLLYYGIANVSPALFPEQRPVFFLLFNRIPRSPAGAYAAASGAAILFLLGAALGSYLVQGRAPLPRPKLCPSGGAARYAWLPGYGLSWVACLVLLLIVVLGTSMYGLRVGTLMTAEEVIDMSLGQQLLFHGLFTFLPVAPLLAACAYVQAGSVPQKRRTWRLLVVSTLLIVAMLALWRQRSAAMLAILLPISLLIYVGRLSWRRAVVPLLVLIPLAYALVTVVRISDLPGLVSATGSSSLSVSRMISVLGERPGDQTVLEKALYDASYRTAGLEAVAALLEAQARGLEPRGGVVIRSGFLQALPALLRPRFYMPEQVKTAPSYYGVFLEGDWVTTMLAEFVLDFGPIWLFFPAVFAGLGLGLIDQVLLRLGARSSLQGLLILRFAWFVRLILIGSSVAGVTLLFFKSTVGYAALLLVLGLLADVRVRRARSRFSPAPGHSH